VSSLPDLRLLLSINSENAWSDLLATLMNADQAITRSVLGIYRRCWPAPAGWL
jgi:hypothetical protein